MRPESLELESKSRTPVSQSILQKLKSNSLNVSGVSITDEEFLGGVIRGGQLAWIAIGSNLEILSMKTGQRVAGQTFDEKCIVTCVAEVIDSDIGSCLLIVAVQRAPVGGLLYLFSVQGSRIVHRINVIDKITSCCFVSDAACKRSCLGAFNGCAAVGTEAGEVFLIDLHLKRCKEIILKQKAYSLNSDESSCKIVSAPIDEDAIRLQVMQTRNENINLGIRLDFSVVEQPSPISSILSMPQMQMIVVGLENGLLALFNLCDLNALHLAYPPEADSPLVKLTFLEPADDPRPCVYVWAFHANKNSFPFAVMHSVSFISKAYQDGENIYETFQWCRPDLTIPIHEKDSKPISCQSVTKIVSDEEDEQYSLCLLAWTNRMSSLVLVFDLNQWYKEQMPRVCDWRDYPSYLAPFPLDKGDEPLDIWMNPKSVATFNSIQRPEEHFYPISLSFDLIELQTATVQKLHWGGLQNNAIKKLSNTGAVAILMPNECFHEFLEASLIPQLSEQNYHASPSKKMKQEFLLSMALEYNCMGLLRECAQQWADGSHMGRGSSEALTLSTLTDWIWNQATLIKDRCNDLCVSLFDDSGITIDLRSRKILAHYSRQLKLLADILNMIISSYRQYIPDEIFDTLTAQRNSIRMTSEYQEVLQWLLNMGLLPEIVWNQLALPEARNDTFTAIPYPYRILNKFYTDQRQRFYENDRSNIAPKTNSCKCLYIDSFIDRECNSHLLRTEWNNGLGDGLYPPPSLQAMLRILLIPGISLENKYMLFVYLFLDLHMVLESEHFNVVQNLIKFPAVFNLNSSLIKTTQAFWNLDHNEYEIALKELVSPLTSDRLISQWQQELLVNTLLIRDMPNLALQAIRAPGPSISTTLRIKTLLANNLITEAFELQRSKYDEKLLLEFFKGCHEHKKWNYVLGLSLTDREGEVLCKFLNTCDSLLSENLQLIYLLQRNRYIEALTYLDDLKHKPRTLTMHKKLENTQDMIISSYKLAMNSTNRKLCEQYMAIKNRLDVDVQQNCELTSPLSSQLNPYIVDTNANVVGSVFHRAIVAAKRTGFNNTNTQKSHIPLLGNIRIDIEPEEIDECKPIQELKPYSGLLKRRKECSYEHSSDPDQKQPAAKRQRTDSFSIADIPLKKSAPGINSYLLTSLTNQSHVAKQQMNMSIQELDDSIDNGQPRNSIGELCETVNLLSTPVVKSSRLEKQSRLDSRCQTPQSTRSILKQRHTEIGSNISRRSTSPSLTANSRRSVDFNAKPFCYTIPSQSDDFRLGAIQETANVRDDDDSNSFNSPSSIKGRRPIHSGKNSSTSNSIDEFYSPETSKVNEESKETSQEIGNENLSRISHHTDTPALDSSSSVRPRRGLRSKTPEIPMMSSTRITRSRSKLNLEDSVDYENVSEQPALNTSTPKRTPAKRTSRSLSKNVITSNALKVQSEVEKSVRAEGSEDSGSLDVGSAVKQRNFLKDASEMSMKQTSFADSVDELDASHLKYNLLQDSSSFASERSESEIGEKSSEHEDLVTEQIEKSIEKQTPEESQVEKVVQEEVQEETEEEVQVEEEIQEEIEQQAVDSSENQMSFEEQNVEEPITVEHSMESVENEPTSTHVDDISNNPSSTENIVTTNSTIELTETVTEHPVITHARQLAQNVLIDSSMGESNLKIFNRYDHYTSSFFTETSTVQQNLLEDSSICTTQATAESIQNTVNEPEIVDIFEVDSRSESSSSNTVSSGESSDSDLEGNLVYDESDNDDDNNQNDGEEVIQVLNSSEEEEEYNFSSSSSSSNYVAMAKSKSTQQREDVKYDINDEPTSTSQAQTNQFEPVESYDITELPTASIQITPPNESSAQSLISQEQAMNEMIYGDLGVADAEMLDLDVHRDAFGFEMHGERGEQNQGSVYLEAVKMSTATSEQVPDLLLEEATTSEQAQVQQQQEQRVEETQQQSIVNSEEPVNQDQAQENIIDDTVTIVDAVSECDKPTVSENIEEPVSETGESSTIAQEQTTEVQPTNTDETNILDKAVIIDESVETTAEKPIESEPTDIESIAMETDEPTNIFEKAAVASTLDASESVREKVVSSQQENTPKTDTEAMQVQSTDNARKSPEKLTTKDDTIKKKSSVKRPRRAASQQDLSKDEEKDEEKELSKVNATDSKSKTPSKQKVKKAVSQQNLSTIDETNVKSNETKSKMRVKRATSQQPLERSADDANRTKRSASEDRQFKIQIKRLDSDEARKKDSQQNVDETQVEDPKRKKRGASQQKDVSVKVKTDDEPSTSKVATTKRTKAKSVIDLDLGDKFDAEESEPSRRLRKAISHQSLSEVVDDQDEVLPLKRGKSPSRKKTESTGPRRAVSHQSLSSISDESQADDDTKRRTKRTKSVSMQDISNPSTSRMTRRTASQQQLDDIDEKEELKVQKRKKSKVESTDTDSELGDKFDANESAPSRRLRKAVSHQTLSSIDEGTGEEPTKKVKTPSKKELNTSRTTRRATSTQSISSAIEEETKNTEVSKPRSRKRVKSESTDTVEESQETETKSPKTRSRRAPSETKQSPKGGDKKETRKTSTRSSKKDDDTHSETSSIVSTRSRKTAVNTDDETSSVKSSRVRGTRSASVLPAIAEHETQATVSLSQDYLETSRLTRSQRANIEKYSKLKEKISVSEPTSERKGRKTKADNTVEEQQLGSDHSDSESVASQKSNVSKVSRASKRSKTSEASSSQRTTRQRAQKK